MQTYEITIKREHEQITIQIEAESRVAALSYILETEKPNPFAILKFSEVKN